MACRFCPKCQDYKLGFITKYCENCGCEIVDIVKVNDVVLNKPWT